MKSLRLKDLTPVEESNGILYKRDDLYRPFSDLNISGGKVRQACALICGNYKHIRDDCDGLVVTPSKLDSLQGIIIARVAKEFGLRSLVLYGGTKIQSMISRYLTKYVLATFPVHFGAMINCEAPIGVESCLQNHLQGMIEMGLKCFNSKFDTKQTSHIDTVIKSTGFQVQNIPNDLDVLVIPCVSYITACGILWGLVKAKKIPQEIYLINVADKLNSRHKIIRKVFKKLKMSVPTYEIRFAANYSQRGEYLETSIAYSYMYNYLDIKGKKVLFWYNETDHKVFSDADEYYCSLVNNDPSVLLQSEFPPNNPTKNICEDDPSADLFQDGGFRDSVDVYLKESKSTIEKYNKGEITAEECIGLFSKTLKGFSNDVSVTEEEMGEFLASLF